jgi:hypothetical protein
MRRARRKRYRRSLAWSPEATADKGWSVEEWQEQVLSDKTRMGYWPWVNEKKKSNFLDDCIGDLFAKGGA